MRLNTAYRLDQEDNRHERNRGVILAEDSPTTEVADEDLSPRQRFERLAEGVGLLGVKDLANMINWSVTRTFDLGLIPGSAGRHMYMRMFVRSGVIQAVGAHWLRNIYAPLPMDHEEMVAGPASRSIIGAEYVELVQLDHKAAPHPYEPLHDVDRALAQLSLLEESLKTAQGAAGTSPLAGLRPAS